MCPRYEGKPNLPKSRRKAGYHLAGRMSSLKLGGPVLFFVCDVLRGIFYWELIRSP